MWVHHPFKLLEANPFSTDFSKKIWKVFAGFWQLNWLNYQEGSLVNHWVQNRKNVLVSGINSGNWTWMKIMDKKYDYPCNRLNFFGHIGCAHPLIRCCSFLPTPYVVGGPILQSTRTDRKGSTTPSLADLRGSAKDAQLPSGVQILSFSCGFQGKFGQIIGWRPHLGGWHSPSRKSWIRHFPSFLTGESSGKKAPQEGPGWKEGLGRKEDSCNVGYVPSFLPIPDRWKREGGSLLICHRMLLWGCLVIKFSRKID